MLSSLCCVAVAAVESDQPCVFTDSADVEGALTFGAGDHRDRDGVFIADLNPCFVHELPRGRVESIRGSHRILTAS